MNVNYTKLLQHPLYQEDLAYLCSLDLPWNALGDATILLSGATGMLGSHLIDALLTKNIGCKIYALGRSAQKLATRFEYWKGEIDKNLFCCECDINQPLKTLDLPEKIDYVIHLASNTHPVAYATDPVGTIMANIYGTKNLLDCSVSHHATRFAFASSNEIYGENRGDVELFDEKYGGYIDCNTLRAGYPESKRCGEALCQAYRKQYGLDVVIPRFTRSFGPTLLPTDTKALSQFLHNALNGEDIVLKSDGMQYYSYTYATDAIAGLLTILLKGTDGEAYNIADEGCDIRLKDLAQLIAESAGRRVIFDLPNETEKVGFSKATKARLDSKKLRGKNWKVFCTLAEALRRTIVITKETVFSLI